MILSKNICQARIKKIPLKMIEMFMIDTQFMKSRPVFSYNWRYIVGFRLVEMAKSTNPKPTIYRNLYENTGPVFINNMFSRHSKLEIASAIPASTHKYILTLTARGSTLVVII